MDGLVEKSSFPFHRSDYLCRESVNAAITHSFCRKCRIYALFCRKCRDYALFGVEFYAEFLAEILRILAENLRKLLSGGASALKPHIQNTGIDFCDTRHDTNRTMV